MSVHPNGSGSGWTQDIDVDQPHGLDYRSWNHLAIAVRKRINQEHSDFADATVGGIHKPGGCAVLAMEEGTATIVADGTLRGRGLCWDLTSRLWCATAGAGASTSGDWTLVLIHPDKQWAGGDVTWTGGHEFDASMDVTGNVAIDGDVSCDGTGVFGGINCAGDVTVDGTGIFGTIVSVADISADGTTVLTGTFLDGTTTFNAVAGENGPTFKIFGDWSSRSNNTSYLARTDGVVHAFNNDGAQISGLTDTNNPPTTVRIYDTGGAGVGNSGITMVVKGGNYWKTVGAVTVYWIPLGDNT